MEHITLGFVHWLSVVQSAIYWNSDKTAALQRMCNRQKLLILVKCMWIHVCVCVWVCMHECVCSYDVFGFAFHLQQEPYITVLRLEFVSVCVNWKRKEGKTRTAETENETKTERPRPIEMEVQLQMVRLAGQLSSLGSIDFKSWWNWWNWANSSRALWIKELVKGTRIEENVNLVYI